MAGKHQTTRHEDVLIILAWNLAEGQVAYGDAQTAPSLREALDMGHTLDVRHGDEGEGWWTRYENYRLSEDEQRRVERAITEVLVPALLAGDSYALEGVDILPILREQART